jgi:hypothetical protein
MACFLIELKHIAWSDKRDIAWSDKRDYKRDFRHLKNKVTDLRTDRRPAGTFTSGLKSPEQLETLSVPPNDSFGFDDDQ